MRRKERVAFVDFHEDEDEYEEKPRWCPSCEARGYLNRLGPKILMPGEVRQVDYFEWLQCTICYNIIPRYEAKAEQALEGFAETTDNPFEDNKVIESVARRSSPKGKKQSLKRKKEKYRPRSKDKEIDELLRIYGEQNVKIHYDSMPDADTH
jgi:hypothetical protein